MRKLFKWLLKTITILLVALILLLSLLFVAVYYGVFGHLPTEAELASIHNEEASLVLASDGSLIGKYFAENRTNISWEEVPPHLVNALVATEDKRFYLHEGYDSRSYLRVFFKTILLGDRSAGGGSTLTQQLIKNLFGRNYYSFLSMPVNKIKEAIMASRLENVFSKEEVLLLYLNSVPFGEEVYGIEAAAKRYFDKHARELNVQESAVLVGILKANTYYNPRLNPDNATQRRNQVLTLMYNENYLTENELDSLTLLPLNLIYANYQKESPAGYFVYQVKKRVRNILENISTETGFDYDLEKDGLRIYTTLDNSLQQFARQATNKQLNKMQKLLDKELSRRSTRRLWQLKLTKKYDKQKLEEKKNREIYQLDGLKTGNISLADSLWHYHSMLNAAVLIAEPTSGRVLCWVGGNNYRYLPYDMVYARRQIASAIKPLIYSAALENGFTPCSYLKNEVVEYEDYNNWKPENYDKSNSRDTLVALWYALANSMNLPTVDLYFQTGQHEVADMLRRFHLVVPGGETPAISLGAIDVSLYEIVSAYSTFANYGSIHDDLVMIDKITDAEGNTIYSSDLDIGTRIIQPYIADQITVILEKAINEGTGRQIRSRFGIDSDLAGKTGTAQNYSNAWFMSYTPNLVIGTWVGARSPEMHFNSGLGSGSALALPIS
ncbi:MAG: transglycosylase domain-containing protein, partial [Thermodesulfobacteriota bacterium]|nr:transglycosylase domain-containing protein [Thermodesulfobacteriota bacterium]